MANRYEILRKLGQGGMGTVFLAKLHSDAGFQRLVALKKLSPDAVSNADLRGLFEREVKLGAQLVHPTIVQVLDAGLTGGEPYLSTEFVDGADLEDLLAGARRTHTPFSPEAIAYIAAQVCEALAFMISVRDEAGQPLIQAHRDVSPGNVLIARNGGVKLADFGVARLTVSQTSSAVVRGKWQYFAPEISSRDPDVRADMFALGIVMYQLASLRHPFEASTAQGFYERASTVDPPKPEHMPDALWSLIRRALAKEPELRFQTPEEMAEALNRFISSNGAPISAMLLARQLASLFPPPVPTTRDPHLAQPFVGAALPTSGGAFEMDPEWQAIGPSLGVDGKLSGPPAPIPLIDSPASNSDVRKPAPLAGKKVADFLSDAERINKAPEQLSIHQVERLELHDKPLVEKPPEEELGPLLQRAVFPARPDAPGKFPVRAVLGVVGLIGVIGLGLAAFWAWKTQPRPDALRPGVELPVVLIDSQPNGADVFSGNEKLGQTPLSFPNDYPSGNHIPLVIKRRGYKAAQVDFVGGQPQHVNAKLERAR